MNQRPGSKSASHDLDILRRALEIATEKMGAYKSGKVVWVP